MSKERETQLGFEQTVLPHLDAAYNLARWILGNEQDAQDVVQEAALRAFQYFGGFQGSNSRAWLLTIVRNACYTWLRQNRTQDLSVELIDEISTSSSSSSNPELTLLRHTSHQMIRNALDQLPVEFRELIVLRELEGLSYKEIAGVAGIPLGTVMSRLARARHLLRECLVHLNEEGGSHGL